MSTFVYLVHADGKLPNIALMRLASYFRARGRVVTLVRGAAPRDPVAHPPGAVYASSIFAFSAPLRAKIDAAWGPGVVWGGTGVDVASSLAAVDPVVDWDAVPLDYSLYPDFAASIGFLSRGCRLRCGFCLTPDSVVITAAGPKPIAAVVPGDLVLTHQGRYRRVTEIMSRHYEGDVMRLRSGALSELFPTTVTPEHLVWTRHVSYRSGGQRLTSHAWRQADGLLPRHQHRSGDVYAYPRQLEEAEELSHAPGASWLALNEATGALLGWYLAEGYVSKAPKRGYHRTTFCLGHTARERAYADDIVRVAARLGLRARVMHPKIGIRVAIESVALARWLVEAFGTGAAAKTLPLWVRRLPPKILAPLLRAWTAGDGTYLLKKGTPTWRLTTVAPALALGAYEIALRLGFTATLNRHRPATVIQGRAVNAKPSFTLIYHPERSVVASKTEVYRRVEESQRSYYSGPVFNLEVDEDHSYCTPAFAVHNCVVPSKEGKPRAVATVADVWRGPGHPKHLHLLDNDAFAPALRSHWRAAVDEMVAGDFRVCFSQGLNVRLIDDESAALIARLRYTGHSFDKRRLFTAWDALGDEAVFRRGVATLARAGVPARHLRVYMLVGYDARETWEAIFYRHRTLTDLGCEPFPMVYDRKARPDLAAFSRWGGAAMIPLWRNVPWPAYAADGKDDTRLTPAARAASAAAWDRVCAGWTPPRGRLRLVEGGGDAD